MHPFEKRYTEGLEPIKLEGVTFYVKLPTQENIRFQRHVAGSILVFDMETGEHVRRDITPSEIVEIQIEAFIKTCIRKVEGWDDYTPEKMLALPDACEDLWSEVSRITNERNAEAATSVKKSETFSDGPISGKDAPSFMDISKAQAK